MSTTGQVRTFGELYDDLRNRMRGHSTTGLDNVLKRYINIAHQDIYIGTREKMPWAERRATLVTQDDYSTGTVSITKGSTTLTGSGTAWNTANAFGVNNVRTSGKMVLAGGTEVYQISAIASDTSLTLASHFTQSDLSADTYLYFEDEYDLASDFLRPIDFRFFDLARTVTLLPRDEFRRRNVASRVPGKPTECTILDLPPSGNTTPIRRVWFNRPANDFYSIPYAYVTKNIVVGSDGTAKEEFTADADEPIMPLPFRHVITERALYWIYRDRRDDNRANQAMATFTDLWLRIVNDYDLSQSRARMSANVASYWNRARRPMGGVTPNVTSGTAFDELRE